ncbi:bifunctional glutamate N-acetyltransferase/amino-acid acetyltransferase ArgJ [Puniceicoccaceae bacterium K14]|nr:bifunctional glutamate N-acetyltransferase/amino-acid acetyltransferase ArgJ [Puniceicoccaceae bacterium K14]
MDKAAITFQDVEGGVASPIGFYAAGGSADVRKKSDKRLDTGVVYSLIPCAAAGVFTINAVKAAPVLQCQSLLESEGRIHGIVANSGNANACTGAQGKEDAAAMSLAASQACGVTDSSFLVCSTGRIGELLPMESLLETIKPLGEAAVAGAKDNESFGKSILTSDTKNKVCTAIFEIDGKTVTVGGCAKGAGMIEPNMATMLAFITTDIDAESEQLKTVLQKAVKTTFNAITVDGDMSTNDTVLLLANGESDVLLNAESEALFQEAVNQVCDSLADKIVADGERITKVVEILISGAANEGDAENIARAIGNSLLVKTSWYGNDPNWGRLMDALGYAKAKIDQDTIDIFYDDVPALEMSTPVPENKPKWKEIVSKPRFSIRINMHQGDATYRLRASDLTEGYVDFNKSE